MFHKIVDKAWNLFKHSEQLSENSILQVSIGWDESSIDLMFFSIDQIRIE